MYHPFFSCQEVKTFSLESVGDKLAKAILYKNYV